MNKRFIVIIIGIVLLIAVIFLLSRAIGRSSVSSKSESAIEVKGYKETVLLDVAQKSFLKGDTATTINNLEKLIAKYPDAKQAESWYFLLGRSYENSNDLLKAKDVYKQIIEKFPKSEIIMKAQDAIDGVNVKILFSPTATNDSFLYDVEKGDALSKIAKKFGTTMELIAKANKLKDGTVKLGSKLKISKAKFSIVVDKSQNILTLKSDNDMLKTYRVSTGKNSSTPVGTFKITIKVMNPVWYTAGAVVPPESSKNILGSRWMGISKQGYGIHGTTEPQSIGKSVTAGCVRMKNSDVEELYSIVPEGTEVVIVD